MSEKTVIYKPRFGVREELENEKIPWYWYTELSGDFFAKYFIPGQYPIDITELELVNTAMLIDKSKSREATAALTTAVWELYNRGYAVLETERAFRMKYSPVLFAGKTYDKDHVSRLRSSLQITYKADRYDLHVYFSKEGEVWFNELKDKFDNLFNELSPFERFPDKGPEEIPEGYLKHGVIRTKVGPEEDFYVKSYMEEIE